MEKSFIEKSFSWRAADFKQEQSVFEEKFFLVFLKIGSLDWKKVLLKKSFSWGAEDSEQEQSVFEEKIFSKSAESRLE